MGKASSKHKVDKPELVLELFKKAGHTHHIKPGHVLIEQGKESESLFLVVGSDASGGRAAIRAHPYWKEPEWELVDARQLPSPMRPWLARRMKPRDDNKTRKQQAAALKTASQMARVDSQKEMMGAKEKGNGSAVLAGWDFTSSDAITQEYVENVASCVSLL